MENTIQMDDDWGDPYDSGNLHMTDGLYMTLYMTGTDMKVSEEIVYLVYFEVLQHGRHLGKIFGKNIGTYREAWVLCELMNVDD